jgi:hypothetical protein
MWHHEKLTAGAFQPQIARPCLCTNFLCMAHQCRIISRSLVLEAEISSHAVGAPFQHHNAMLDVLAALPGELYTVLVQPRCEAGLWAFNRSAQRFKCRPSTLASQFLAIAGLRRCCCSRMSIVTLRFRQCEGTRAAMWRTICLHLGNTFAGQTQDPTQSIPIHGQQCMHSVCIDVSGVVGERPALCPADAATGSASAWATLPPLETAPPDTNFHIRPHTFPTM